MTMLFPSPWPPDPRKLDRIETQARVIEMADLLRSFAVAVEGLPRSDDLVLMLASSLISDGRWRGFEGEPTPGLVEAMIVFDEDDE